MRDISGMTRSPHGRGSAYGSAGVDYDALDAGKRDALTEALATSGLLTPMGGRAIDESRGERYLVIEQSAESKRAFTQYIPLRDAHNVAIRGLGLSCLIVGKLKTTEVDFAPCQGVQCPCLVDFDCFGTIGYPRCNTQAGLCVACIPDHDNCPFDQYCGNDLV